MDKTLGLIAGNGRFPLFVAKEARRQGYRIVSCGIEKEADLRLRQLSDSFCWVKIGELKKMVRFFQKEKTGQVLMAGKIQKVRLFQENVKPDLAMLQVVLKTRDFKDDSLLSGIADYLEKKGIELLDSTLFVRDFMPGRGVLGKKKPSREVSGDIKFGFGMAKSVAGLDIGQTVIVKRKAMIAVEAIEGTDRAIRRAAQLAGSGTTVVKVAKPDQDMRFDVPAVGLQTLKKMIEAKVKAFAFEADKTIFLDQDDFIRTANKHGIALVGVEDS